MFIRSGEQPIHSFQAGDFCINQASLLFARTVLKVNGHTQPGVDHLLWLEGKLALEVARGPSHPLHLQMSNPWWPIYVGEQGSSTGFGLGGRTHNFKVLASFPIKLGERAQEKLRMSKQGLVLPSGCVPQDGGHTEEKAPQRGLIEWTTCQAQRGRKEHH